MHVEVLNVNLCVYRGSQFVICTVVRYIKLYGFWKNYPGTAILQSTQADLVNRLNLPKIEYRYQVISLVALPVAYVPVGVTMQAVY